MIEGGWSYVVPAYIVALGGLLVLTIIVLARLRAWELRAKNLDKRP